MDPLVERFLAGDRRALARILTRVEDDTPEGRACLRELYPRSGRAHTVGITGGPGAGKSTLTGALAAELRRRSKTVGIIAVDPSSPFSRGAILGDRIRMQQVALDPGVFVRSMASRGALGALAPSIHGVIATIEAFGFDYVLIETVGAGQDEVEVAGAALTTVLVNNPGTGDDIQALKAGILEIADVLVVNKADHPGADTLVGQLRGLLALSPAGERRPDIVRTIATSGEGVAELADAIDAHLAYLRNSGSEQARRHQNARHQVVSAARTLFLERIQSSLSEQELERLVARVAARDVDPHTAGEILVSHAAG